MKALLFLMAFLAAAAITVPTSLGAGSSGQGYRFITDTLGGSGHAADGTGYRLITDTLGGSGGAHQTTVIRDSGFRWSDAGIGAVAVAGLGLLFAGSTLVVLRRRSRVAV
jgi:hypothetical protein